MTLDLDAVRARYDEFQASWDPEYMAPDGPAKAARSAEDIPALLVAVGQLKAKVAMLNNELAEGPLPVLLGWETAPFDEVCHWCPNGIGKDARVAVLSTAARVCESFAGGQRRGVAVTPAQMVAEFHDKLCDPATQTVGLRNALIREEVAELIAATDAGDRVGMADALADCVYVLYGTAHVFGIDLDAVLAEVHRSNMSKELGPGGKAVKGPTFSPADVAGVLAGAR